MKVGEVMSRGVETVDIGASVAEAAKVMKLFNVGIVPVMAGSRVVGVVTDRDLAIRVLADPAGARWTPVVRAMSDPYVSIGEDRELEDAIDMMSVEGVSRLVVLDLEGKPAGILSVSDIAIQSPSDRIFDLHRALGARYRDRHVQSAAHQHSHRRPD